MTYGMSKLPSITGGIIPVAPHRFRL